MLRLNLRSFQAFICALLLALLLAPTGRAAPPEGLSDEQLAALETRVRERWQALADRDYDKAWGYGTPVYRSIFSKDLYVLQFSYAVDRWLTGVEVVAYDADAAVASVTVRVMSKPLKQTSTASASLGALPLTPGEKWILIDGEWWFSAGE